MERHRIAIRILGAMLTSHGFAYALTEGPEDLIDWGRVDSKSWAKLKTALTQDVERYRPLFVAADIEAMSRSSRGRTFTRLLKVVCSGPGIMILCVERVAANGKSPTNYEVAENAAKRFSVIAGKLPKRRQAWMGVDDRIGIFLAAAAAGAAWDYFRPSHEPAKSDWSGAASEGRR
jgi:hypothetical protein